MDCLALRPTHANAWPFLKVYFVDGRGNAHGPDPDVIAAIQADGGRHDVTTVGMWANNDVERAQTGEWTFFQPCQSNTSADAEWVNTILPDVPCNHRLTTNSSFGSQMSAAFSWQTNHASPPWDAPSKLMGLTFQVGLECWLVQGQRHCGSPLARSQGKEGGTGLDGRKGR